MAADDTEDGRTPDEVFEGFEGPNYTQVPDAVFDRLMPILSGAEFKVLCYVVRRTFGFRKGVDAISLTQIISGITTRAGRQLDGGTGLSRDSVTKAIKSLEEKGVIVVNRRSSPTKGDQPSTYGLRFRDDEAASARGSENRTPPLREIGLPPVRESDPQETVEQQTVGQDRSKLRTAPPTEYDGARDVLLPYVEDIAREFRDTAPVRSTLTRVVRIQRESGLNDDDFIVRLMRARQITKERTGTIRSGEPGRRQQVAYWLATLEDLTKTG